MTILLNQAYIGFEAAIKKLGPMEEFSKFVEALLNLIQNPVLIWGFILFGFLVLLLPDAYAEVLGIYQIRFQYRGYIFLFTLGIACLGFVQMIRVVPPLYLKSKYIRTVLTEVNNLPIVEKAMIFQYVASNQKLFSVDVEERKFNHKFLQSLVTKEIIFPIESHPNTFVFPEFVWIFLRKNKAKIFPTRPIMSADRSLQKTEKVVRKTVEHFQKWILQK